jgi:hypothetical protein
MKYRIADLNMFITPKADKMSEFSGIGHVDFEFPKLVKTVLFINCGLVRASLRGGQDHYEVVGRLYESSNPKETGENHVGKLFVHVYNYPHATIFKPSCELLKWRADGSFDISSV